jgi:hypothetical protein
MRGSRPRMTRWRARGIAENYLAAIFEITAHGRREIVLQHIVGIDAAFLAAGAQRQARTVRSVIACLFRNEGPAVKH